MNPKQISRSDQLDHIVQKLVQTLGDAYKKESVNHLLKSVLWSIRNHLPFKQAIQFLDQLPIPLKAMYVEQWEIPERVPEDLHNIDDLADKMIQQDPILLNQFRWNAEELRKSIKVVLKLLGSYLSSSCAETKSDYYYFQNDIQTYLMQKIMFERLSQKPDSSIWLS
ncbi:DUF2267 domain-containing protein [Catalinimonas niigatensis]|uniref:hypothetical protein n=1 Tax=Catalinimonas niigatensis TaxID=1397264 RepID=UPI0026664B39|nr:hypothetical protein [Catalinimonas niigatensis]WPP49792.1 hypothetical protein PZB72_24275 [Catalinimonas niigatensis]